MLIVQAITLANSCYSSMFAGCTSLINAPTLPATTLANSCYSSMFAGCTSLINAPTLPATTLANSCYSSMFKGCTSLIEAPALPATTLKNNCYSSMFAGCTSLVEAPALPATTTLDGSCYSLMFQGCTSLINAPTLSATTLTICCYQSMFEGCTSLIEAPALPATTTLADSCYSSMFKGCTSLIEAPALPATTLKNSCFLSMFQGCTNLTTAPKLDAATLVDYCYLSMFQGCTSLTTAPKLDATTLAKYCYQSMFSGCTSLIEAPALSATTLKDSCYLSMFKDCTSLIEAPALSATTLAENCYQSMFSGCTNLTEAPTLSIQTLVKGCYQSMFEGCTNLTEAPLLPATTLAENCYKSMFFDCTSLTKANTLSTQNLVKGCYRLMFAGCTSLIEAPALSATALADYCYQLMFSGCTSLTSAPALPASTLTTSCYQSMFLGCTSLIEAPALSATTLAENCYQSMFQGCTNLTEAPTLSIQALVKGCYRLMFAGCTSLIEAPALSATTLAGSCYSSMFEGCTNLTTAPKLDAATLANYCYLSMFQGCTSLTIAPALPASTLTNSCYQLMFSGCTSLTSAPALPASTLTTSCYQSMFENCINLSTLPNLSATTLATKCYYSMFKNCANIELSTESTGGESWSIPADVTTPLDWNKYMFDETNGAFADDPIPGTTYYLSTPVAQVTFDLNNDNIIDENDILANFIDCSLAWNYTVSLPTTSENFATVKLLDDWTATSHSTRIKSFGSGDGFGPADSNTEGAILVGANDYIILDLNGKNINRDLGATSIDNGYIIGVKGTLHITDTSTSTLAEQGEILGGNNSLLGGAIFVDGGNLIINRGNIHNNIAKEGGAIYVKEGTLTINDGQIYGNSADKHGAIYMGINSIFILTGGIINYNNTESVGGAITVDGTLKLSGDAQVVNNYTDGELNNTNNHYEGTTQKNLFINSLIYFDNGDAHAYQVDDTFNGTIGISFSVVPTKAQPHVVTSNWAISTGSIITDNNEYNLEKYNNGYSTEYRVTPNEYTITFKDVGGDEGLAYSGCAIANQYATYEYGVGTWLPTAVEIFKKGYSFVGWVATNDANDTNYITIISKTDTGNKTFYAKWMPIDYEITYNLNGGENNVNNPPTYNLASGTISLAAPTKAGCEFVGWFGYNSYPIAYYGIDYFGDDTKAYDSLTDAHLNSSNALTSIPSFKCQNLTFVAKWNAIEYNIYYSLNDGTNSENNPKKYTVETDTITLENPTKAHYTFAGWYSNSNFTGDATTTIAKGSTGDKSLFAKWIAFNYTINYILYEGTNNQYNKETYNIESSTITLFSPTKVGYTFAGWFENSEFTGDTITTIERGSTGDKSIFAKWTAIVYSIDYELNGGTINENNLTNYTIENGTITLKSPTKLGYDFVGWFGYMGNYTVMYFGNDFPTDNTKKYDSLNNVNLTSTNAFASIPSTTCQNLAFVAKWTAIEYTISYTLNYGINSVNNPTTYNIETETIALENPTRVGYTFAGWFENSEFTGDTITTIAKGSMGDKSLFAKWTIIKYYIFYNINGGLNNENNPGYYTIETATITLENPTRLGFDFAGWFANSNFTGDTITTIAKGSTGNKSLFAKWTASVYDVVFVENGGTSQIDTTYTYGVGLTLPTSDNISKMGYAFAGWTATNEANDTTYITSITATDLGNKTFYAKWTAIEYTISYTLNDGTNSENNPAKYTIETATITLENPTRLGFDFAGWYANSNFTNDTITTIAKGSTGNKSLFAKWTAKTYSVTYVENNGTTINDATYTYGVGLTLPTSEDISKTGYTFAGWTATNEANDTTYITSITATDLGNKTLYAKWTVIDYTISYTLNDGTNSVNNPTTYNIETATITLENPTKVGFDFAGWFENNEFSGDAVTTIALGSTGNKSLFAKWTAKTYSVTYVENNGTTIDDATYTYGVGLTLPTSDNISKTGYTLAGWTATNEANDTTYITSITATDLGNKTFYAKWTANLPSITDTPNDVTVSRENGFNPNITIKVEVLPEIVSTDVSLNLKSDEKVAIIYDIKLLQNSIETQPDGTITIKVLIPEVCKGKNFRILHIHNGEVLTPEVVIDGNYAIISTDKLSEFVFVVENEESSFAWIFIILIIIVLCGAGFVVWKILDKKKKQALKA